MPEKPIDSYSLHFLGGGSDKVYNAAIERSGDGYVVNASWGRRGGTLQHGSKTPHGPVTLEKARTIFMKFLAQKTGEGYRVVIAPGSGGEAATGTAPKERVNTGRVPQLPNEADESEAARYIEDPAWGAQEKMDGKHLTVLGRGADAEAANKKGMACGLPDAVRNALAERPGTSILLDGEAIEQTLHAFDILEADGRDLTRLPYRDRHAALLKAVAALDPKGVRAVPLAVTREEKQALFDRLKAEGREGIVFKRLDAPYVPGRPNSGGDMIKIKFWKTASVVVTAQNDGKRSVSFAVLADGKPVEVGNVTIPPNQPVPAVDAVVEVRYIYAFPGGSLFQPTYLGERDDIDRDECLVSQLKYKADNGAAA